MEKFCIFFPGTLRMGEDIQRGVRKVFHILEQPFWKTVLFWENYHSVSEE